MGAEAGQRNKQYVLVVDGKVDDRFQTGMVLQRLNYNICTASSIAEAIDIMHVAPPAVIVAEALIGVGIASRIKKDARFSGIPIIVLAQAPDLDLDVRVRQRDLAACILKPLDVEKFYAAVQLAVEKTPRKNIRIGTCLLTTLQGVENGKGCTTVLSEYGMFFRTEDPQPLNSQVTVNLEVNSRTIKLTAVVLYSYSLDASPFKEPGMGMKFVKISPEDQAFIKSYILEQVQGGIPS